MSGRKRRRLRLPDGEVGGRVRGEYCCFAFECLTTLALCSEIKKVPGHYFRVNSPGGAWPSLVDAYSFKTQGASLALLHKLDSVRIGTDDDPTLKLLEIEDFARSLRSSHSQWQHLTEPYVTGKLVNDFPREYDIQKQMMDGREDKFSREAILPSIQKRFEPSTYKQLLRSMSKSAEDQAFAVTGRGKNHPGRGESRHGSGKSGGSQGCHGDDGNGRGGGGGG